MKSFLKPVLVALIAAVVQTADAGRPLKVAVVDCCPSNDLAAVSRGYFNALLASSHVPFLLPRMESPEAIRAALSACDLVLFPGGEDVEPKRYGEAPSPKLERVNYPRDAFEYRVLDEAKKLRKPLFGICRGCQLLNCYFGGTLVQDIPSEIGTSVVHRVVTPRGAAVHAVRAESGSRLAAVFGPDETRVVSWHHQSVGKLAPGFRIAARAADGVVEAIEGVDYPACGVQFHPEKALKRAGVAPLKAVFDNLAALAGAEPSARKTDALPVVAIADYCSVLTNVCAKSNLVEAQEKAGYASIVVPEMADGLVAKLLDGCDAVMIGGGIGKRQDYPRRCAFEHRVIDLALARKLPVAGICHGSQVINLHLGGTVTKTPEGSPIAHKKTSVASMNDNLHRTVNVPGSLMAKVMGEGECTVNSSHTMRSEKPAPGLRVTSRSPDGVIEAFEHETLPIRAFQFHPERLWKVDPRAIDLIRGALRAADFTVDDRIPAGNVKVLGIDGDTVRVAPDLRDTEGNWFYWAFRVTGAKGRTLVFRFDEKQNGGGSVGVRGPAVTKDGGKTWSYPCDGKATKASFSYTFAEDGEVRFYETWQYLPPDWEAFLAAHAADRGRKFETGVLCRSRKGRDVPRARFGRLDGKAKYRVFMSSRHHCSEATATAVLEGVAAAFLTDDDLGRWLCENVELMMVPFTDFDGVVDGDQGKSRRPHDHNRDYQEFLYPETRAIRDWIASHAGNRLDMFIDVHCPWIRGQYNEFLYTPWKDPAILPDAAAEKRYSGLLEKLQCGSMRYRASDDLPFGVSWNKGKNYHQGWSAVIWACQSVKGLRIARSYEVPFANANGAVVTPDVCRALGRDTAKTWQAFFTSF